MTTKTAYHHGDLHAALLIAAKAELESVGLERFSLRKVAARAGVSHAAPAHHFRDANGLLTSLAAEGLRLFLAAMERRDAEMARDPRARLHGVALGYTDFAREETALFRLIYSSERPDRENPELVAAHDAACGHFFAIYDSFANLPRTDMTYREGATALWSMIHGLADLAATNRLPLFADLDGRQRDNAFLALLDRLIGP